MAISLHMLTLAVNHNSSSNLDDMITVDPWKLLIVNSSHLSSVAVIGIKQLPSSSSLGCPFEATVPV